MILSKMQVVLDATTSGFARQMNKAELRVKNFGAGVKRLGAGMAAMASKAALAGAAMAAIVWPTKKTTK